MKVDHNKARRPSEEDFYEVKFYKANGYKGSIYFRREESGTAKELENDLHGPRNREDYIEKAAKKLIREANFDTVFSFSGEKIAELKSNLDDADSDIR